MEHSLDYDNKNDIYIEIKCSKIIMGIHEAHSKLIMSCSIEVHAKHISTYSSSIHILLSFKENDWNINISYS